jgi:hypothetical protein
MQMLEMPQVHASKALRIIHCKMRVKAFRIRTSLVESLVLEVLGPVITNTLEFVRDKFKLGGMGGEHTRLGDDSRLN